MQQSKRSCKPIGGQVWLDCFMSRCSYTEYAPTITTRINEAHNDFIMERELIPINTDQEGNARTINAHYECMNEESVTSNPRDGYGFVRTAVVEQEPLNTEPDGTCRTIKATCQQVSKANLTRQDSFAATGVAQGYRIRKLTPRECFRLMDVSEKDIDTLLNAGISNSQLYKMAGNSIVVACLYHIFDKLFIHTEITEKTLF